MSKEQNRIDKDIKPEPEFFSCNQPEPKNWSLQSPSTNTILKIFCPLVQFFRYQALNGCLAKFTCEVCVYKVKAMPNKVCIMRLYKIKYCIFRVNRLIFSRILQVGTLSITCKILLKMSRLTRNIQHLIVQSFIMHILFGYTETISRLKFVYICMTHRKAESSTRFPVRNTNIYKIRKPRRVTFSIFHNISPPNFAVLLILDPLFSCSDPSWELPIIRKSTKNIYLALQPYLAIVQTTVLYGLVFPTQ